MKVREFLDEFEKQINKENLRANTKRVSIYSFRKFINNLYSEGTDINKIDSKEILKELKKIKFKSELSSIKNSILRMKKYNKVIDLPKEEELKKVIFSKSADRKKISESKSLDTIKRKINAIKDKKLKLAYRLALSSGLRVSEIDNLNKNDIKFSDSGITILVKDGKGGKDGIVRCLKDPYLEKELKQHIEIIEDEKVFYTKKHMMNKALSLGFECHDLRRAFSKKLYEERKPIIGREQAKIEVQQALRHTRLDTTNIYLNSNIDI